MKNKFGNCTIVYSDKYNIHFINEQGLIFLCIAELKFSQKVAFAFLKEVQKEL